jgi:hypothetical protein
MLKHLDKLTENLKTISNECHKRDDIIKLLSLMLDDESLTSTEIYLDLKIKYINKIQAMIKQLDVSTPTTVKKVIQSNPLDIYAPRNQTVYRPEKTDDKKVNYLAFEFQNDLYFIDLCKPDNCPFFAVKNAYRQIVGRLTQSQLLLTDVDCTTFLLDMEIPVLGPDEKYHEPISDTYVVLH